MVLLETALLTPMMLTSVTWLLLDMWTTFTGAGVFVEIIVSPKILKSTSLFAAAFAPTRMPSKKPAILTSSIELFEASRYIAALATVPAIHVNPRIPRVPVGLLILAQVVVVRARFPLSKVILV